MRTTRRVFLKSSGMALVSVGLCPSWGPRFLRDAVFAAEPATGAKGKKTLVCIFQRGAVDGLSMVVPHGDPAYYDLRSTGGGGIAIARTGTGSVIDLDGHFGLHPALEALKPIYDSGHLAAIQACGSPSSSRSHFDAQKYMESGTPDQVLADGWLTRALEHCPEDAARAAASANGSTGDTFRSVSLTAQLPLSLRGSDALAISSLRDFAVGGAAASMPRNENMADGFEAMYQNAVGDVLHGAGTESFEAMKLLKSLSATPYTPGGGASYPRSGFGSSMQQVAQLIKADVGVEVAFVEVGGWDTHSGQGGANGRLANNLRELGGALAAFHNDLGDKMDDVVVMTMSEFGRTARQNGTGGTDHGHATCFFVMGGAVNGGKVLGDWPGVAPDQLNENRDLKVTTDFRDVFAEVAGGHLGVTDFEAVFPGRAAADRQQRGILRV